MASTNGMGSRILVNIGSVMACGLTLHQAIAWGNVDPILCCHIRPRARGVHHDTPPPPPPPPPPTPNPNPHILTKLCFSEPPTPTPTYLQNYVFLNPQSVQNMK